MLGDDKYCPRCAALLELREVQGTARPACPRCGRIVYHDPKVTAVAVVETGGKVLMVRRALEPGLGLWSLPGGYVDRGEMVEAAAAREVLEETGLEVEVTGLVGVFSQAGQPVILVSYDSRILGGSTRAGPEVLDLGFFPLDDLPPLAFPRDRQVLDAWKELRDGHA
jgi:ADP-ribose pyrophosphatase YjhB (NUDIX family)